MAEEKTVQVTIQRYHPPRDGDGAYCTYQVPFTPGMSVTNVLHIINETYGAGLAYRVSCRRGLCGCCLVKVNGRVRLGCCQEVTGDITLEPAYGGGQRVLKDLVLGRDTREKQD